MKFNTISIIAAESIEAQNALSSLNKRYETVSADKADIIVALGGDGFMLQSLHQHMQQ